jgi:hypothetical protein
MPPASRRLPEDSVVASLSEIQAILQTGEQGRTARPAPRAAVTTDAAPPSAPPSAPVPSAAELRATREARWREEMLDASRMGQGDAKPRRPGAWLLGAGLLVAIAGAAAAYVTLRPAPAGDVPSLVVAPAAIAPTVASVAAPPPTTTAPAGPAATAAEPTAFTEPPPVRKSAKGAPQRGGRGQKAARPRSDDLDSVFGPRRTVSSAQPKARTAPPANRKKTRADAQLDSVLDSL